MNARTKAGVAAAVAAVLAAGCSSGTPNSPPSTADPTAVYLATVRPLYPSSNTDRDLLNAARTDCAALDAGIPYSDVLDRIATVVGLRRSAMSLNAAISLYCPSEARPSP